MSSPTIDDLAWLKTFPQSAVVVWASPSVRARVIKRLPFSAIDSLGDIPSEAGTLVVAGGGSMMDEAKHFRARVRPDLRLILIASIWGSGAALSPVVVLNRGDAKVIATGEEFLPDAAVYWPELLASVGPDQARRACGDTWAHALEAFLSPLAADGLRGKLAILMGEMLHLPLAGDARWLHASAHACALQAQASVGLVHGIAHVLEHPCRTRLREPWGHARLCSIFLLPVMSLNRRESTRWSDLANHFALNEAAIWNVLHRLFEPDAYAAALPLLHENWAKILRNACTRTNGTLIRSRHLEEFEHQVAA